MNHLGVILYALCVLRASSSAAEAASEPRFIVILADNLGAGGCLSVGFMQAAVAEDGSGFQQMELISHIHVS